MNQVPAALWEPPEGVEKFNAECMVSQSRSQTRPGEEPLAPKPPHKLIRKILVATDFSAASARAVECAISLANTCHAALTVLHVIDIGWQTGSGAAAEWMKELWAEGSKKMALLKWSMCGQLEARTTIEEGLPWEQILNKSSDFDLVVMGKSRPTRGWKLFSQRTGKRVIENASCPVIVV